MQNLRWRYIVGGSLIFFGIISLLSIFLKFDLAGIFWALLFAAGGIAFLSVMVGNRQSWWAAFPGFALLGIGATIALSEMHTPSSDWLSGAAFLGCLALSFMVVYLMQPTFWWAIIPAGTLLSLSATVVTEPFIHNNGWVFLMGLSLTFLLLMLFKDQSGERISWAIYPGIALLAVAMLAMLGSVAWAAYLWPIALIAVGVVMVVRSVMRR